MGIADRVTFHTEVLPLAEYQNLCGRAKVFLSAQNRQQAMGTMQIAYKSNCDVYLKKSIELDDQTKMINPAYLFLQILGYSDIKNITDLEKADPGIILPQPKINNVNEVNVRNPEYKNRVFEMLKR